MSYDFLNFKTYNPCSLVLTSSNFTLKKAFKRKKNPSFCFKFYCILNGSGDTFDLVKK